MRRVTRRCLQSPASSEGSPALFLAGVCASRAGARACCPLLGRLESVCARLASVLHFPAFFSRRLSIVCFTSPSLAALALSSRGLLPVTVPSCVAVLRWLRIPVSFLKCWAALSKLLSILRISSSR